MNPQVAEQLTRARTALVLDQPFFGALALRLKLVEDVATKTLSVDGKRIRYNPEFVAGLSPSLTKSAIGHEVFHCVVDHIGRRGGRDPRKFNQAGDYVINAFLKDAGFELGTNWLYNPAYAGMSTDEVYNLLPDSNDEDGNDPLDECEDGHGEPSESDAADWKIATLQAAEAARAMGKLPGSLARFVEGLTLAKVDWRALLQRFVSEVSKNDYSWMRPNRRFIAQGIFLPTLYSENMGSIAIGIDTSGSIDQHTLNTFGAEIRAIVQTVRPEQTTVIYCDAAVNHVDTFQQNDELHFDMHGGGGTDLRKIFDHIATSPDQPICAVVLTDGYTPFGDAPDYPVLWCCTTDVVAPWGETVRIEV